MLILGSCHCANVRFTLDWSPEADRLARRQRNWISNGEFGALTLGP